MSYLTNLSYANKLDGNSVRSFGIFNGTDTSITYVPGIIGQAASFNGSTSKIQITDSTDFTFGTADFTANIWVKFNATGAVREVFCGQSNSAGTNTSISVFLERNTSSKIHGIVCSGSTAFEPISSGSITDSNWHMITLVRSSTILQLYIDAAADGLAGIGSAGVNDALDPMGIGCAGNLNLFLLNGLSSNFYTWKRALSPIEIATMYANKLSYPFSNSNFFQFL